MRNAALTLGLIAGLIGMVVGFFGYGYTALIDQRSLWVFLLLVLVIKGAGPVSIDRFLASRRA